LQRNKFIKAFLFLCFFATGSAFAERTSGYCAMSEEEKGKEVLSLYPRVFFHCIGASPLRNRIWVDAWIKSTDLYDGIMLMPKAKIYNQERKTIGKVVTGFNPLKLLEVKDSLTHIVIAGFLEKSCTDNTFIAEEELGKLLDEAAENEKFNYFEAFIKKYELSQTIESNQYTSYLLVQPNFTQQILEPRLLMVFYQGELIAIFYTRELRVKKYDSIEMGTQFKMIYNSKFSEHTKQEMVGIYKKKLR